MYKDIRVMNDTDKCVDRIGCRYDLVLVAAARTRELLRGDKPKLTTTAKSVVTALQEIEEGLIGREYLKKVK